jgi:hypothetical protein
VLIGEFIVAIILARVIGSHAESKGHPAGLFVGLTFVAWIMGGLFGLMLGAMGTSVHPTHTGLDLCFVYFSCLCGQATGLGLTLFLVVVMKKKERPLEDNFNVRHRLRNSPERFFGEPRRDDRPNPSARQESWQRRLPPDVTEKFGERLKNPREQEEHDGPAQ